MMDDVTAIRIMIRLINRSESRSIAVRIPRAKHADVKEMDQEPDGCDVIRLVIRLIYIRDPAREKECRREKETDQKPDDVTVIRLLIRLMILRGKKHADAKGDGTGAGSRHSHTDPDTAHDHAREKACRRKRRRIRSRMTSKPYGS